MSKIPVIAIFDVGKTNKKLFLFDEDYRIISEETIRLKETADEDGFPCEDVHALTGWVNDSLNRIIERKDTDVKAINFSAYGASFVHIDNSGKPITHLYNYLKPYPRKLEEEFYDKYGGAVSFSRETASPLLGNLNSGLQLYRLKYEQPSIFEKISCSLHLPQYLSMLVTGRNYSDITSIGCHTGLWNFSKNHYHRWVYEESIIGKLAGIFPCDQVMKVSRQNHPLLAGTGLHDSSAALIPYLSVFKEPFILLSTGTWCISLNPFNQTPLTEDELAQDCLCYMEYRGKPIKASRLFAGNEHEKQVKRLAVHFNVADDFYKSIKFSETAFAALSATKTAAINKAPTAMVQQSAFSQRDLSVFADSETAYHQLLADIISQQVISTGLVLNGSPVKRIFVDGGFGNNPVYMNMLANAFPQLEVSAATVAQASAIGAALAVHRYWNTKSLPADVVTLRLYPAAYSMKI